MENEGRLGSGGSAQAEPQRSRWAPKPEQILILESIFNGGMVNPPKEETVRIRRLLEKFGAVADANVFYWFQNRRSRLRRRQRQMQAAAGERWESQLPAAPGIAMYDCCMAAGGGGYSIADLDGLAYAAGSGLDPGSSSSFSFGPGTAADHASGEVLSFSGNPPAVQEFDQSLHFGNSEGSHLYDFHSEMAITVFINGIATEVGPGALDLRSMFGGDFMLYHSSGLPIEVNEFGLLVQALRHGESYFLVPKNC
ncbi:WUSCHEL-related homeobox 11-like [Andrographis paniculata]|uniref:WUSCHEL-related homeobox 11-like n=1 Tax=Andrographis paniculata TaxID=175694 RepID=UPI0021E8CB5F|nr:WUSCHEL-related homeobox 11-like [Andrographis paniculata]